MRKSLQYTTFLLSLTFLIFGCKSSESTMTDTNKEVVHNTPQEVRHKNLLWEISGNGLTESSYLFGTIHMIDADDFFWPAGTLSAVDASKQMMFELDMDEMQDPMKLMPMMQKAFMKGDTTLSDLLTIEEYAQVKDYFAEIGLPLFLLERIKPMFLTVFASGDIDPNGLQNGSVKSYEFEFTKLAADGQKEVSGLETIEFQISIFDDIPYKDQAQMLIDALNSGDSEDGAFQQLVNLYQAQDIYGLYDLMQEDKTVEDYEDVLLDGRNKNWIPIMETEMSKMRTFFAVGAGHLAGKNGVINLLREQGYTVAPVKG